MYVCIFVCVCECECECEYSSTGVLNQTRLTGKFKWLSRESSSRGCAKSFGSPYMSSSMIPTLKLLEYTRDAKPAFTNLVDDSGFTAFAVT